MGWTGAAWTGRWEGAWGRPVGAGRASARRPGHRHWQEADVLTAVTKHHNWAASDDRDVFSHGLEWRWPRAGPSWGWRGGRVSPLLP